VQAFFEDGTDDDVQGDYSGIFWIIVQFVVMFMNLLFIVLFFMVCMLIASLFSFHHLYCSVCCHVYIAYFYCLVCLQLVILYAISTETALPHELLAYKRGHAQMTMISLPPTKRLIR
jgi:hypothetical protein